MGTKCRWNPKPQNQSTNQQLIAMQNQIKCPKLSSIFPFLNVSFSLSVSPAVKPWVRRSPSLKMPPNGKANKNVGSFKGNASGRWMVTLHIRNVDSVTFWKQFWCEFEPKRQLPLMYCLRGRTQRELCFATTLIRFNFCYAPFFWTLWFVVVHKKWHIIFD